MKIDRHNTKNNKRVAKGIANNIDGALEKVCWRNLQYLYRLSDEDDIPYKKKKKNKRKSK